MKIGINSVHYLCRDFHSAVIERRAAYEYVLLFYFFPLSLSLLPPSVKGRGGGLKLNQRGLQVTKQHIGRKKNIKKKTQKAWRGHRLGISARLRCLISAINNIWTLQRFNAFWSPRPTKNDVLLLWENKKRKGFFFFLVRDERAGGECAPRGVQHHFYSPSNWFTFVWAKRWAQPRSLECGLELIFSLSGANGPEQKVRGVCENGNGAFLFFI